MGSCISHYTSLFMLNALLGKSSAKVQIIFEFTKCFLKIISISLLVEKYYIGIIDLSEKICIFASRFFRIAIMSE